MKPFVFSDANFQRQRGWSKAFRKSKCQASCPVFWWASCPWVIKHGRPEFNFKSKNLWMMFQYGNHHKRLFMSGFPSQPCLNTKGQPSCNHLLEYTSPCFVSWNCARNGGINWENWGSASFATQAWQLEIIHFSRCKPCLKTHAPMLSISGMSVHYVSGGFPQDMMYTWWIFHDFPYFCYFSYIFKGYGCSRCGGCISLGATPVAMLKPFTAARCESESEEIGSQDCLADGYS